jgi:DNA-binding LytR/AlgR family response regulator
MKKIKCIIVDSDPFEMEKLKICIQNFEYLELVETFNSTLQLDKYLNINTIDLMFMTVEMPHLSGITFLETLDSKPLTILTSADSKFALDAFNLNVVDYLLKPFSLERFAKSVNKSMHIYTYQNILKNPSIKHFIYVKSGTEFIKIYYNDIEYISGLKDYSIIHSRGEKIIISMSIKTIYAQLPDDVFSRISKSYIINTNYIKAIKSNSIRLFTKEIPLGKVYKTSFFTRHFPLKLLRSKTTI